MAEKKSCMAKMISNPSSLPEVVHILAHLPTQSLVAWHIHDTDFPISPFSPDDQEALVGLHRRGGVHMSLVAKLP